MMIILKYKTRNFSAVRLAKLLTFRADSKPWTGCAKKVIHTSVKLTKVW